MLQQYDKEHVDKATINEFTKSEILRAVIEIIIQEVVDALDVKYIITLSEQCSLFPFSVKFQRDKKSPDDLIKFGEEFTKRLISNKEPGFKIDSSIVLGGEFLTFLYSYKINTLISVYSASGQVVFDVSGESL